MCVGSVGVAGATAWAPATTLKIGSSSEKFDIPLAPPNAHRCQKQAKCARNFNSGSTLFAHLQHNRSTGYTRDRDRILSCLLAPITRCLEAFHAQRAPCEDRIMRHREFKSGRRGT